MPVDVELVAVQGDIVLEIAPRQISDRWKDKRLAVGNSAGVLRESRRRKAPLQIAGVNVLGENGVGQVGVDQDAREIRFRQVGMP